jgi:threonylcarbamoyladenosine tRNA methylthiotransferase MtaB
MATEQPRASVHTIGCRLNQAETALLADQLQKAGYRLVEFGKPTELLVLNTCSVTERAESDCRYVIRLTQRRSPRVFIAVTGCYAQTGVEALRRIPGIDLIVGTQYKMQLPEYLPPSSALRKQPAPQVLHTRTIGREDFELSGTGEYSLTRANLKIQDGCNFMCAFCIIPFARGHERSRHWQDVLREAKELAAQGHRELVLTGVNIGRYSQGGLTLLDLIQRLEAIPEVERIRISSIEPTTIPDALLEHMATSSKLCPYLHIPLQSGDDAILQTMNRRYSVVEYRAFIEKALSVVPELALGTDVMVGFPGEGEPEFQNTISLLSELPFAYFHVFSFSQRPGTAAGGLENQVSPRAITRRRQLLAELSRAKRIAFYQRYIGRTVKVLFEVQDADLWTGLTDNFMRVGVRSQHDLSNVFRDVLIIGTLDGLALGNDIEYDRNAPPLQILAEKGSHAIAVLS